MKALLIDLFKTTQNSEAKPDYISPLLSSIPILLVPSTRILLFLLIFVLTH